MEINRTLRKNHVYFILIIFFVSLSLRAVYYIQIYKTPVIYTHYLDQTDMNFFYLWAKDIASGDWLTDKSLHPYHVWHNQALSVNYGDREKVVDSDTGKETWNRWYGEKRFHQEPLYPYFLAIAFKLFGDNVRWIFILQFLIGSINNVLIYIITRRFFGNSTAIIAAIFALFYGPFISYESTLLRVPLMTFTMLVSILLFSIAFERKKRIYFLLSGLSIGISLLTNSTIIIFFFLIIPFLIFHFRKSIVKGIGYIIFLFFGLAIALSPLIIRNIKVGVGPLQMSSVGSVTFICVNAEDFIPGSGFYISKYVAPILKKTQGKFIPTAYETIRTHSTINNYFKMLIKKFLIFWNWYEIPNNINYYYTRIYSNLLSGWQLPFSVIGILSFAGLIVGFSLFKKNFILYFAVISGILPCMAYYNLSRFRVPVVSILIPFAAYAVIFFIRQIFMKKYIYASLTVMIAVLSTPIIFAQIPMNKQVVKATDYIGGNNICIVEAQKHALNGDYNFALAMTERVLKTEPDEIWDTKSVINKVKEDKEYYHLLLRSFGSVHLLCSLINRDLSDTQKADYHYERYIKLSVLEDWINDNIRTAN